MTRFAPVAVLVLAAVFFATTGFQCGSAETTSAKLYMQQKQWDKAEQSLTKEVSKNDKNEEAWFLLGQVRLELKKYKEMNDAYNRALALSDAHKADINRNKLAVWGMEYNDGVKFYNGGREDSANYNKALDAFTTAIAMQPDSSSTYYVTALAYYSKKDYNNAISVLQTALEKKPNFGDAARFLGQVHYQVAQERANAHDTAGAQAEYQKAIAPFEQAYKAEPDSIVNITDLIDVYERTKNTDKAMALTHDAVAKEPNNKLFRYAYGVFLLKQDKYSEAIEQFQKAVQIDPNYGDAVYNLGVSYLNWGVAQKKESDEKAEAEQKRVGRNKQVKTDDSYRDKFKQALPYLEKSAELRSDDAALWQQLGRLYAILNMSDKSKAAFEKSDKLNKGQ